MSQKNRLTDVVKMLVCVIAILFALSFLNGSEFFGWEPRRIDLLSDLFRTDEDTDEEWPDEPEAFFVAAAHVEPASSVPNDTKSDTVPVVPVHAPARPVVPADTLPVISEPSRETSLPQPDSLILAIEDYSDRGDAMLNFYRALSGIDELGRPVRIAFLGDSFIEGDILTSDLREYLQAIYGGRGVGFVPLAPLDRYRNTVNIDHEGWTVKNSMHTSHKNRYLLNGQCFVPEGNGYVSIRTTDSREHASAFDNVGFLFYNNGTATLDYRINRKERIKEPLDSLTGLQLYNIRSEDVKNAELRILNPTDFIGYGLVLNDDTGVCVDNFSLRSSSGTHLSRVNVEMLRELDQLMHYDLVVLQYGLNVVEPNRRNYSSYVESMTDVILRLKEAMPRTSFLLFGVGDRCHRNDNGEMTTMAGVISMIDAQREIARATQSAFWNTYQAMGGRNSMKEFVRHNPPLANKDYTHINYHGGKRIARSFGESLVRSAEIYNHR